MHVKTLNNVSGAQTGGSIDLGLGGTGINQVGFARNVEVVVSGTNAAIVPTLEVSDDAVEWLQAKLGSAGDELLEHVTGANFCRVVTTGTGGTYDVDVFVSLR